MGPFGPCFRLSEYPHLARHYTAHHYFLSGCMMLVFTHFLNKLIHLTQSPLCLLCGWKETDLVPFIPQKLNTHKNVLLDLYWVFRKSQKEEIQKTTECKRLFLKRDLLKVHNFSLRNIFWILHLPRRRRILMLNYSSQLLCWKKLGTGLSWSIRIYLFF